MEKEVMLMFVSDLRQIIETKNEIRSLEVQLNKISTSKADTEISELEEKLRSLKDTLRKLQEQVLISGYQLEESFVKLASSVENFKELERYAKSLSGGSQSLDNLIAHIEDFRIKTESAIAEYKNLIAYSNEMGQVPVFLKSGTENISSISMEDLCFSLEKVHKAYRELLAEERNSEFGKKLKQEIAEVDKEVEKLEVLIGKFLYTMADTFGNSSSLEKSVYAFAKDLPKAFSGAKGFLSVMQTNIPKVAKEFKKAELQHAKLIELGKSSVPVWKQLARGIFNWKTAIVAAAALLIANWDKIRAKFSNASSDVNELNRLSEEAGRVAIKESAKLDLLYKATQDHTKSIDERRKAAQELQKMYPSYFANLSQEEILIGNAITAYDKLKNAIIASAKAKIFAEKIVENEIKLEELAKNKLKIDAKLEAKVYSLNKEKESMRDLKGNAEAQDFQSGSVFSLQREVNRLEDESGKLLTQIYLTQKEIIELTSRINIEDVLFEPRTGGGFDYNEFNKEQAQYQELLKQQELDQIRAEEDKKNRLAQQEIDNQKKTQQELFEKQEDSWDEYLIRYGTFQQKKEALSRQYNKQISEAENAGQAAILQKEFEEALATLDINKFEKDINWELMFSDLERVTKKELQKMKKQLIAFKDSSEFKKNATPENMRVIEDAISSINSSLIDKGGFFGGLGDSLENYKKAVKEVTDAQNKLNEAVASGNEVAVEKAQENLNKATKKKRDAEVDVDKSIDKFVGNMNSVAGVMKKLNSAEFSLSNFGDAIVTLIETFGNGTSKIGGIIAAILSIIDSIGDQGVFGFVSDLVGNILGNLRDAAIKDIKKSSLGLLDTTLFKGADYDSYNKMKEQYDNLNEVWSELLNKKKEYIGISYGDEAYKVGAEAEELVNKSIESYRKLGVERLNSGASTGSHSIGVRIRERMSKEGWGELKEAVGEDTYKLIVGDKRLTGIFDLPVEQLEKLKYESPAFWAKLDKDVQDYITKIIDGEKKIEEIQKQIKEQATLTSFDNVYNSFLDILLDMDKSAADFADDFERYLQKAVIGTMLGQKFRAEIEAWYDDFAKANDDEEGITEGKYAALQSRWNDIVENAINERDFLMDMFGWSPKSGSQESTKRGFEAMSQDTADELNGRFTALQMAGEEIKLQNIEHTQSLADIKGSIDLSNLTLEGMHNLADETRNILRDTYLVTIDIRDNTSEMLKPIREIRDRVINIEKSAKDLVG